MLMIRPPSGIRQARRLGDGEEAGHVDLVHAPHISCADVSQCDPVVHPGTVDNHVDSLEAADGGSYRFAVGDVAANRCAGAAAGIDITGGLVRGLPAAVERCPRTGRYGVVRGEVASMAPAVAAGA